MRMAHTLVLYHPFIPTLVFPTISSPCLLRPRHTASRPLRRPCLYSSCSFLAADCATTVPSAWVSAVSQEAFWEEPDDGSGSECEGEDEDEDEEEGGEEGGGWGSVSDFEGGDVAAAAAASNSGRLQVEYEEFVTGVELLLEPHERAVLHQNEFPDLSKTATDKWAALHSLALSGQIPFIDKLIDNGFDINSVDNEGYTPLHVAVIGKKEAVISHLLRKGASPHIRDKNGITPLHYAVQVGAMQTVKLLIKYNVDVNVADDEGWTPLHVAIQSRSRDIAKVLLVNGADKNRRNKDGKTPLDLSLCFGKEFKSYELAKLVKLVPQNRELRLE